VTEPDPVAALAAQIEDLRGQLARYAGETGRLRARLDEGSSQEALIRLELKKLGEKADEANGRRQAADPPAPYWLGLSREEHTARLAEVRAWVDRVARVQWPGYLARLAPCWASHPEAVWELSNLMTEWARVYADPDSRPLEDALWFFERWLPGVLSRLAQAVTCDVTGCQLAAQQRQRPPLPPRYT